MNRCISFVLLLVSSAPVSISMANTADADSTITVRNITINRANIFGEDRTRLHLAPRLINRFHIVTQESVIRREIWFEAGQTLTSEDLKELERNIRDLDLFAEVTVSTQIVGDTNNARPEADIVISTTDRLSVVATTGGSFLGGVGEVKFSVGEKNLFGLGHSIEFGYKENTVGELLGSFAYDNVRLFDGDAIAGIRLGQTEEGNFAGIKIRNEFDHNLDTLSWKIELDHVETRIDFFDQGESVAEVPRTTDKLVLNRIYRSGNRTRFWRYGPVAEYRRTDYSPATGTQSENFEIPDDVEELFAGGLLGYDVTTRYSKIRWLDTLDYEQDLSFGFGSEIAIGATDTLGDSSGSITPAVFFNSWWRNSVGTHELLAGRVETAYVFEDESQNSWSASLVGKFFSTRFNRFTLASSVRYASGFNATGLPAARSLGEDNGLRGYPAREFNGEQSLLLNLENRISTPIQWLTFSLGAVTFIDVGWVGDRGLNDILDDPHASAGFGLRIGSSSILGSSVIRLDFAFPFDEDPVRDYQPLVSLSTGQVFKFQ